MNVEKFIYIINMVDWQPVLNETDIETVSWMEQFQSSIMLDTPYRNISKKYYNNKPCLSTGLKESLRLKINVK